MRERSASTNGWEVCGRSTGWLTGWKLGKSGSWLKAGTEFPWCRPLAWERESRVPLCGRWNLTEGNPVGRFAHSTLRSWPLHLRCSRMPPVRIVLPELDAAPVGLAVERNAGAALLDPEGIAHHGDGRHRDFLRFGGVEAADDAPVGGYRLAFLEQLRAAVKDGEQVVRHRRFQALEPAGEHGQLGLAAGFVAAVQQVAIGVGDGNRQAARGSPIAVDVQLAEVGVAVEHLQGSVFVEAALELFGGAVLDGVAAAFLGEQAGAGEGGEDDGHGRRQI